MTILEVMHSGRPFRRKGLEDVFSYRDKTQSFLYKDRDGEWVEMSLDKDSSFWDSVFHCTDWEIIEEPMTITKEQLYKAHDMQPVSLSAEFTNNVWADLKDIINWENKSND